MYPTRLKRIVQLNHLSQFIVIITIISCTLDYMTLYANYISFSVFIIVYIIIFVMMMNKSNIHSVSVDHTNLLLYDSVPFHY